MHDIDDNESFFRDWLSSPSNQMSDDSPSDNGALNITSINNNNVNADADYNAASYEVADTMKKKIILKPM